MTPDRELRGQEAAVARSPVPTYRLQNRSGSRLSRSRTVTHICPDSFAGGPS